MDDREFEQFTRDVTNNGSKIAYYKNELAEAEKNTARLKRELEYWEPRIAWAKEQLVRVENELRMLLKKETRG